MKFYICAAAPLGYRLGGRTAIRCGLSARCGGLWQVISSRHLRTKTCRTAPDSPLLDLSDAAVKKLIRSAKKRGYVTHDQLNLVLPSEEVNSEQIEDMLAMFREMGVSFVETQETSKEGADPSEEGEEPREEADEEAESESGELVEVQQKTPAKSEAKGPTERTKRRGPAVRKRIYPVLPVVLDESTGNCISIK